MKGRTVVLLAALGIFGFVERDAIVRQWDEIFPKDPTHAAALARCAYEDHEFNGFSADARADCYRRWLVADGAPGTDAGAAPDAADPARAAGQSIGGRMPEDAARAVPAAARYRRTRHDRDWAQAGPLYAGRRDARVPRDSSAGAMQ